MCICEPCICICGTRNFLDDPMVNEGYPEAPRLIICPKCSSHTPAIYKTRSSYFSICFIPLCVVNKSEPYLCCSKCYYSMGTNDLVQCDCGTSILKESHFCPNCGVQKTHNAMPLTESMIRAREKK